MTCPPSLQQQKGTAASSRLPLDRLPSSGLQPPAPGSTTPARGRQAGEGQQAERGYRDPEQRGGGRGRLERLGLERETAENPPLASTRYPKVCSRGSASK